MWYRTIKLLNCAGDSHEEEISCLAVDGRFVFTGCGCSVLCFKQGKQVRSDHYTALIKNNLLQQLFWPRRSLGRQIVVYYDVW